MFLRGEKKDARRISYVFAYDYRNKGDPAKHNWQETYPTVNGDPPSHIRFPVVFPYPHLPPIRQPTPVPDTSLFTPYQHPTSLTANTVSNAEVTRQQPDNRSDSEQEQQQLATAEANNVQSPQHESGDVDVKPRIKNESSDVNVKTETVKREEKVYAPSKAFRSTIEQLRQPSATVVNLPEPSVTESPEVDVKAKLEEPGARGPSESFAAAISQIRSAVPQTEPSATPNVKVEQPPAPPSDAFVAAIQELRAPPCGL
ncbi:hypothetical protein C8Q74DRAFT_1267607 [Fomes fomentarius]|nr:hypothetical protein C8Q74DRAFT_1267607 [Fomes fomentarius]